MNDINTVIISGTITDDPMVKQFDGGSMVARINLETRHAYKTRQGELREGRQFNKAVLWNGTAETAQAYLRQGSKVIVQGTLSTDSYEKDGQKIYVKEIKVDKITPFGGESAANSFQHGGNSGAWGNSEGGFTSQDPSKSNSPW
tara:strand:- start:1839 stop:2270 length:432 start_codon:yes stop_codon:yes gene_type:complete